MMGPMGQVDVVALGRVLAFADERYDVFDYPDVHVCTLAGYVAEAEKQEKEQYG